MASVNAQYTTINTVSTSHILIIAYISTLRASGINGLSTQNRMAMGGGGSGEVGGEQR